MSHVRQLLLLIVCSLTLFGYNIDRVRTLPSFSVPVAQKKFENLRDYFNARNREFKNSKRSGSGANVLAEPKWAYFQNMKFLATIDTPNIVPLSSLDPTSRSSTPSGPTSVSSLDTNTQDVSLEVPACTSSLC